MDDLFAPAAATWQRISPAYAMVLRVRMLVTLLIVTSLAAVPLWLMTGWHWGIAAIAAGLVYAGWQWFRIARWVRAWGYAERDSDLYLTHGLWFKELTVVPYGRMQAVKIESGPLARSLGLANLELVTASLQSSATIPGLAKDHAEQLRDRLTAIGIGDQDAL